MEYWDIYDKNKVKTGRTMKRNDWCLKDDEYHLSVCIQLFYRTHLLLLEALRQAVSAE